MSKRVMIVDDSAAMRSFIISALQEAGDVECVEARSGFDALKELPRGTYDVLISDINMPDINGLELLHFIKGNDTYRAIPVLIISTESKEEDLRRARAMGADGYLTKPFSADALREAVDRLTGGADRG